MPKLQRHTGLHRKVLQDRGSPLKILLMDHMCAYCTVCFLKTSLRENLENPDGPLGYDPHRHLILKHLRNSRNNAWKENHLIGQGFMKICSMKLRRGRLRSGLFAQFWGTLIIVQNESSHGIAEKNDDLRIWSYSPKHIEDGTLEQEWENWPSQSVPKNSPSWTILGVFDPFSGVPYRVSSTEITQTWLRYWKRRGNY